MREIIKTVTLPLEGTPREFRLTKLDAFAGVRLLRILTESETDQLQALLLALPDYERDALMKTCLSAVSVSLPAGPLRVFDQGEWGLPELEHDAWTCLRLTMEVIEWTMADFFGERGSAS